MRISDWSSDVCSSDLLAAGRDLVAWLEAPVEADGGRVDVAHPHVRAGELVDVSTAEHRGHRAHALLRRHVHPEVRARKSVVSGKSVSVRVDLGVRSILKKKHEYKSNN